MTLAGLSLASGFQSPAIQLTRSYDNRGRLRAETDSNTSNQTLYAYTVNYMANGNVLSSTDSQMGSWNYSYDTLNRLATGTTMAGTFCCGSFTWLYDGFGNRKSETFTGSTNASILLPPTFTYTKTATNQPDQPQYFWDYAGDPRQTK